MSTKVSRKSYKPGIMATRNSQEIWQICFDDEDLLGDLGDGDRASLVSQSAADADSEEDIWSNVHDRRSMPYEVADEIELSNDAAKERRNKRKSNRQAYQMSLRSIETEIRATPTGVKGNGSSYSTTPVNNKTLSCNTKTESATSIRPGQTRIHIRRDSDLESLLPLQSDRVGALRKKAVECCTSCTLWPTWRKVLCVWLLVLLAILVYVVIMVAIVKGIGG